MSQLSNSDVPLFENEIEDSSALRIRLVRHQEDEGQGPAQAKKRGGGKAGRVRYNNDLFLDTVEKILPCGRLNWDRVGRLYQESSGEAEPRDSDDLKKHFGKLTNHGKAVTGNAATPQLARAQSIYEKML